MKVLNSTDYYDYVIKDGKFIGEFEQLYRNVDDPWGCSKYVGSISNDLFLTLVAHVSCNVQSMLDVGCGLGDLTARIRALVPAAEMHACDVSPTAINQAQNRLPDVHFFVADLTTEDALPLADGSLDLITMAQVVWYVLPELDSVLAQFRRLLKTDGHLIVSQSLFGQEEQQYGKAMLETSDDLTGYLKRVGFEIRSEVHIDPRLEPGRPRNCLVWAENR